MLKILCTLMALAIILAILSTNNVESRIIRGNSDGASPSRIHVLRIGKDQVNSESSNEDDGDGYIHTKRKSELLSSLYGLPYALVNKRNAD